jgi:hypothetical protein
MVDYVPSEKATPIRQPSTANLMIDSYDRPRDNNGVFTPYSTAGDFQITKNASILNGFFTRIGTTEVVLEWNIPNVDTDLNDFIYLTIGLNQYTVVIPPLFYTVEQCLDNIVSIANAIVGIAGVYLFSITTQNNQYFLTCTNVASGLGQNFIIETTSLLQEQLGLRPYVTNANKLIGQNGGPDIRAYRYLDFVSNQLTYAQDLKDSSTSKNVRDVLCRWYFAWDGPTTYDGYGFPIFQGYQPFVQRRLFSPPKQIRWEPNLPIGNLAFQVYANTVQAQGGDILIDDERFNWLMTLQVSEQ